MTDCLSLGIIQGKLRKPLDDVSSESLFTPYSFLVSHAERTKGGIGRHVAHTHL